MGVTTESELVESSGLFSVDVRKAQPDGVMTESEIVELSGEFTTDIGEARPTKKTEYTVEQIVDVPGPQYHEDIAEMIRPIQQHRTTWEQIVDVPGPQFHEDVADVTTVRSGPLRKSTRFSSNGPEVFQIDCGSGSSLQPLTRRRPRRPTTSKS